MKKLILTITVAASVLAVWYGCKKDEPELPGSIYGVITDKATGEPVRAAGVQLSNGETTVTGNEGQYEFAELKAEKYSITVNKTGYTSLVNFEITVEAGKTVKGDVQIEKLPAALNIVDGNAQNIDTLDFGGEESVVSRSFNIFNDSPEILEWVIANNCPWISSVSKTDGTLAASKQQPVVITIDRKKLGAGNNSYVLNISSDNGTKELTITAIGSERGLATLNTLEATNITASTATFNGEITSSGAPAYTERGFVYAATPMPTIENTIKKLTATVTGTVSYSASTSELLLGQTYYVRAYAINAEGTAYSTNEVSFTPVALLPTLTVQNVSELDIAAGTAIFNGTIGTIGDPAYTERGFVWGTTPNPTIANTKEVAAGTGYGEYSLAISEITEGKTYYVRAYATSVAGTAYSTDEVSFVAIAGMPEVSTQAVDPKYINIGEGTARLYGTLVEVGSLPIIEKGFVYHTEPTPTIDDTKKIVAGTEKGAYVANVSELREGEVYYVRAFARNSKGTVYGEEVSFVTTAQEPELSIQEISEKNIAAGTVKCNATIVKAGDLPIIERGFVYSSAVNLPVISDMKQSATGTGIGQYSAIISELAEGKTYHIRAYVITSKGTYYSSTAESVDFNASLPTVSTQTVTNRNIAAGTATFNGTLLTTGDLPIIERGFVYGTMPTPTVNDLGAKQSVSGTSAGKYLLNMTNLEEGEKYYVRAYVTTSKNTYYGDVVSIDFTAIKPQVTTQAISNRNVAAGTATFNGTIVSAGDPTYTERGFVYKTAPNPIIEEDEKKIAVGSNPIFSANIADLQEGKTYYIKAYATNTGGTVYGEEIILDFNYIQPTITTTATTNILQTSATLNANVVSAGDFEILERGFVYSINENPTITDERKMVSGTNLGAFYTSITELTASTRYYVRAYVETSEGIKYGNQMSFVTISNNVHILEVAKLMVQKQDANTNTVSWSVANSTCVNSIVDNYTDWRLPTKDELMLLYNNKTIIGGFTTSGSNDYYWSSTPNGSYGYWVQSFSTGAQYYYGSSGNNRVRCVRNN